MFMQIYQIVVGVHLVYYEPLTAGSLFLDVLMTLILLVGGCFFILTVVYVMQLHR